MGSGIELHRYGLKTVPDIFSFPSYRELAAALAVLAREAALRHRRRRGRRGRRGVRLLGDGLSGLQELLNLRRGKKRVGESDSLVLFSESQPPKDIDQKCVYFCAFKLFSSQTQTEAAFEGRKENSWEK